MKQRETSRHMSDSRFHMEQPSTTTKKLTKWED